MINKLGKNQGFILPDNLGGRSIHSKIIPTVCNLENMLDKLIMVYGDYVCLCKKVVN